MVAILKGSDWKEIGIMVNFSNDSLTELFVFCYRIFLSQVRKRILMFGRILFKSATNFYLVILVLAIAITIAVTAAGPWRFPATISIAVASCGFSGDGGVNNRISRRSFR